jgi:hypothetical protein
MKKTILVLLMISAAAMVFATGAQETNENGVVELERGDLARNSFISSHEKVELTGTIVYESPFPELKVGSKMYTLTAPGAMIFSSYLNEGDKITVTGYVMDDESALRPMDGKNGRNDRGRMGNGMQDYKALEGNIVLLVESAEIDGTVYQLPWVTEGFDGRDGMRGGRMDNDGDRGSRQRNF